MHLRNRIAKRVAGRRVHDILVHLALARPIDEQKVLVHLCAFGEAR